MKSLLLKDELEDELVIEIGDKAPNFSLKNEKGEIWSLSRQLGKVTVLLFYPQNETLVCNRQLCSVRDNWQDYLKTDAVVVGISPAEPEAHAEFGKKYELPFALLADQNRTISEKFISHWLFPIQLMRGIIVIDAKGIVRHRTVMLRVFRPLNIDVIKAIHEARGDAFFDKYNKMRKSFWKERSL